ncbi:hypothetical protein [Abyssogena phaseoliformis symbiont]|uniref:hypothetical protein n=1 Tax=Abyssogena phaseoliformis symbiont TaxID=596095 RepID=UPI001915C9C2|nr:hypothetical protein [Abyssogena phaseoliformis symbiont]MBW5288956.1 hypothetical protein [Candidatus Ruthia sp. Apha_13_S6]
MNNNEIRDDVEREQIIQEFKDKPLILKLRQHDAVRKQRTMFARPSAGYYQFSDFGRSDSR